MRRDLPTFYYYDHFIEMIDFIEKTYGHMLTDEHHQELNQFKELSKQEQCLYIRMLNRKGSIFSLQELHYNEIYDTPQVSTLLLEKGYVRTLEPEDYLSWLSGLTKEELSKIIVHFGIKTIKQNWLKTKIVQTLYDHLSFDDVFSFMGKSNYIVQEKTAFFEFLFFLYFGKNQTDLKKFTLRDMEIRRVHANENYTARFTSLEEAKESFHLNQFLNTLIHDKEARHYREYAEEFLQFNLPESVYSAYLYSRIGLRFGQFFEKQKEIEKALQYYALSSSSDSQQKQVKLLYNQGHKEQAKELLINMIEDPEHDEAFYFASDFYARKFEGERLGQCTMLLREGKTIPIDEAYRASPEDGALTFFRRLGIEGWHTENALWQSLFGLLFWDELFGKKSIISSSFDQVPQSLKDKSFAKVYQSSIEDKLNTIIERKALPLLLKTLASHWNTFNGLFSWSHINIEALKMLLQCADQQALASMLRGMTQDYFHRRDGYPDLMLSKDGHISFVEVKSEGDVIRRNQLTRLRQMQQAGFECEIYRTHYVFDPDQTYVVIDIETTGGRKDSDRITEIGAVKIKNYKIIDQWHSLVNPQRSIPRGITQLTGISNDMVKEAPIFSEIADPLHTFMKDAVFVAHNVNFDYGFVVSEFKRIGKSFHFPKLCTCVGMRRYYPGHSSYGLANLCEVYGIHLKTHHRALCDAKAAGELLLLINAKREEATVKSF